jgi:hypothetical protein
MKSSIILLHTTGLIDYTRTWTKTERTVAAMIHLSWKDRETIKKVKCVHTDAKKYLVHNALTKGNIYDVKNETEEFYYIIDNSGKVGGFYKEYFQDA